MFNDLLEPVKQRDPAAPSSKWQILFTYPGVQALLFYRIAHWLWQKQCQFLARWISALARWFTGIEIHPAATIGKGFFIDHGMGIVIGETAVIGQNCTLYHGVTLGGISSHPGKRHPTLGDNVIIGAGAAVLGPITIASNARVGSNAVVVRNVPSNATAVGVPARLVFPEADDVLARRKTMAKSMGFDSYGEVENLPYHDPIVHMINLMLDRLYLLEKQVNGQKHSNDCKLESIEVI